MNIRRYYLSLQRRAEETCDGAFASAWLAKRLGEPGTALAPGFPFLSQLHAAGYLAREDLDGAEADELRREAGLSLTQARKVLAALESSS